MTKVVNADARGSPRGPSGGLYPVQKGVPCQFVDRFVSDAMSVAHQDRDIITLASGESRFIIPTVTDHVLTSAWLAEAFLDAHVRIDGQQLVIHGAGFRPKGVNINQ